MKINNKAKLVVALALLQLGSCSNEKNKFLNRNYHAMTTRYNVYFNGNESFKAGAAKIESQHTEDYTQPLPLYIFPNQQTAKSVTSEMDRALEKGEKAIAKHSMFIKKKEYNRWMDENYILMGKAHLYKLEYGQAVKKFSYVISAYPKDPSRYEAMMWMAKTFVQQENVVKANDMFNKLEAQKDFPVELLSEKYLTMTHAHMQREEWEEAILDLEKAIVHLKKKRQKTRPSFLLAQLYDLTGKRAKAAEMYHQVLELSPDYKMAFYAKINTVLYTVRQSGGASAVKAELKKMLTQNRYNEFYDQIYYALAEVSFEQNQEEEGIGYLQKSAAVAEPKSPQRGRSYLRISDYYFNHHKYALAQAYYDSTARFLDKSNPRMDEVIVRQTSLNTLVKNQVIIVKEDSLQALTELPEKELNARIEELIGQIEKQEEQAREQAIALQQLATENKQRTTNNNGGKWYYYNTASINFGKSEFEQRWGSRSLEDDWRRANKATVMIQEAIDGVEDSASTVKPSEKKTAEYYLKNLPFEPAAKKASDQKIAKALYSNGVIYREQLLDNELAAVQFMELEKRFPKDPNLATTLYQLYRIYTDEKDLQRQTEYKQKIMDQFPETEYAKIVADPDYFEKQKIQRALVGKHYESAYTQFKAGYYANSLALSASADSTYKDNKLQPKFDLLKALSYGGLQEKDSMMSVLLGITKDHKGSPESNEAMRILQANGYTPIVTAPQKAPQDTAASKPESPYKYQPNGRHSVIVIINDRKANINQLKVNVSNFNLKNFNVDKLKVSSVVYGKNKIISIKSFKNGDKAMAYYQKFKENNRELKAVKDGGFQFYAISYSNYPTFYKEKNEAAYQAFFEANYLSEP